MTDSERQHKKEDEEQALSWYSYRRTNSSVAKSCSKFKIENSINEDLSYAPKEN
jgi:hypothetical protein